MRRDFAFKTKLECKDVRCDNLTHGKFNWNITKNIIALFVCVSDTKQTTVDWSCQLAWLLLTSCCWFLGLNVLETLPMYKVSGKVKCKGGSLSIDDWILDPPFRKASSFHL